MVGWRVVYTRQAVKDSKRIIEAGYTEKVRKLITILENDPFQNPPSYEKLVGDLTGACSRRINIQHRLVYQVFVKERIVKIIRMWTHYE
jgi:Txe/YoeB family toxin of toxin-antitoxin system